MTTVHPDLQDNLIQASQVAARLVKDGIPVNEIRIRGRARPAVQIRNTRGHALQGIRYAWGFDKQGGFERYAALMDGVQVQWEVRRQQPTPLRALPLTRRVYDG